MAERDREEDRKRRRAAASRRTAERGGSGQPERGREQAERRAERKAALERRRDQVKRGLQALREGGSETRKQLRGRPSQAGKLAGTAGTRARTILGGLLAGLVTIVGALVGFARGPLRKGLGRIGRWLAAAAAVITPARGLIVAAIGCALLLGLSQFVDYRGVSVGGAEFTGDTGTVAPPPEVDRREAGEPHSYAFVPVAVVTVAILALAYARRRWQLTRVAALIGVAAVAVSVFIDRPQGLDEGVVSRDFAGAEAQLLAGFWAQLFAGLGLAGTALLLGQELRRPVASRSGERRTGRRVAWPGLGKRRDSDPVGSPERRTPGDERSSTERRGQPGAREGRASKSRPRRRPLTGEGSA